MSIGCLIVILAPILSLVGLALFQPPQPLPPKTILVGGKTCTVRFVKTGVSCTATGFCRDRGYDEAVCP